jgi:hypothetical protein
MKRWLYFFLLMLMGTTHLSAETIYLKDGTREKTSKVWEQNGYVHFILNGTRNVEIRYAKEIVDHIEADANQARDRSNENAQSKTLPSNPLKKDQSASVPRPTGGIGGSPSAGANQANSGKAHSNSLFLNSTGADQPFSSPEPAANLGVDLVQLKAAAHNLAGVSFYDPKRAHKYWASSSAQFDSVQLAIAALSNLYHRPSDWIEKNMGDTNDLGVIHGNLLAELQGKPSTPSAPLPVPAEMGKVPPGEPSQRRAVITDHPQPTATRIEDLAGPRIEGPAFYDPRRPLKYWISESAGYKTLKEAIEALAQMYHRPPEWIETHMGQTNDLNEIHRTLRQNTEK